MSSASSDRKRERPPLDAPALEALALAYVGRYATTRVKLERYLVRKLRERGVAEGAAPQPAAIAARMAEQGYVDDALFADARGAALTRRGFGPRRVAQSLHAAGVSVEDAAPARAEAEREAVAAALRFARRRRIGPFGPPESDERRRRLGLAAMIRAGHPFALARRIAMAAPGSELAVEVIDEE